VTVEIVRWHARYGDAFARLNLECIERYFEVEDKDREVLDDPEDAILAAGGAIWYAVRGDVVVGTVALLAQGRGVMELAKMAVAPAEQGQGIGRMLVEHAIAHAGAAGLERLDLVTNSGLAPALRLYESCGFRRVPMPGIKEYARGDVYMQRAIG
jgi:ribosomal protein S18 acetylase RimI-like enzyme